ncbi:MAG TPA: hypothetical protein VFX51_08800, partial [Solirubrobacteraceae bacterium]|nr:hypothetical protein [Solirubrobacteraceae bacterium]
AIDERLHAERLDGRGRRFHRAGKLPDGAFILHDGEPWLVLGDDLLRWTPAGYSERVRRPPGAATAITPRSLLAVLRSGWGGGAAVPLLHPSSQPAAGVAVDPQL